MTSYQSIIVRSTGGPEVLEFAENSPELVPDAGEVLVEVAAVGVNFIEIYQRSGIYSMNHPFIPGSEFSGTVVALGPGVEQVAVGDRVMTSAGKHAYGQYALASESVLVRVPDDIDLIEAAAIPLQGFTAHYLTRSVYEVSEGDVMLVHAGAGGVGQILTQLGVALGATVITTASTEEKRQLSRNLGAAYSLPYEKFVDQVRALTEGEGAQVVYDGVGKDTYLDSLRALRIRGHLAIFGAASGPVPSFDIQLLNRYGSLTLSRPSLTHFTRTREEIQWRADELFGFMQAGKLKLNIGGQYPLAQAADAHRDLEGRQTTGKLLLIPARTR